MRLLAIGIADSEGERFGILQENAAAPHGGKRQHDGEHGEHQHLPAVAFDSL
jgi:hypothetical protein